MLFYTFAFCFGVVFHLLSFLNCLFFVGDVIFFEQIENYFYSILSRVTKINDSSKFIEAKMSN